MKTATVVKAPAARDASSYDADFFEWTQRTAQFLREGRFDQLDIEPAAEEIADMGRRDFREICSRLDVLLVHLLKWKFQRPKRSSSWRTTILTQRLEIERVLQQSPSLRPRLQREIERAHDHAVKLTVIETRLAAERLSRACPFTIEQILDADFLPD
jgi:hypothetical protein